MARTRTQIVRSAAPTIRIQAPAPVTRRARARATVRRVGRAVGGAVVSEKHTMTALLSALVLGWAEKQGTQIPSVAGLSPAATVGLAAWLVGRMTKSRTAEHVATGLLSVEAYRIGRGTESTVGHHVMGGQAWTYE